MELADYVAELDARGFSAFTATEKNRYVNWGYFEVARRCRWTWEEGVDTFSVAPGTFYVDLSTGSELPNFKSLRTVAITTAGYEAQLRAVGNVEFAERWQPWPLSTADERGEPEGYHIWLSRLYILPPPDATRSFEALYWKKPTVLSGAGAPATPITPTDYDEAIMLASEVRCHRRAKEYEKALECRAELESLYNDMLIEDTMRMEDEEDRVTPDLSWL